MTLAELSLFVALETGAEEYEVLKRAEANWPAHREFKPTQARLLVALINRELHRT
jgi:hypothetical protein